MSEIPPDISSAAQSGIQAHEVAKERGARSAGQVNAAARQVKTVDEAGSTVETTDNDVAIFSDAEGAGSQGRESEETPPKTRHLATTNRQAASCRGTTESSTSIWKRKAFTTYAGPSAKPTVAPPRVILSV